MRHPAFSEILLHAFIRTGFWTDDRSTAPRVAKELSVSAGFGIPIMNGYNNRSMLHSSGQWSNLDASGLIKENTFRINIGFTFNEKWFAKFKVD